MNPKTFHFPDIVPTQHVLEPQSRTGAFRGGGGAVQTDSRQGEHLRYVMTMANRVEAQRRRIIAALLRLNGRQNRLTVRDHNYSGPSGSLAVSELMPALTPANYSTSAWLTLTSLSDGMRAKREQNVSNGVIVEPVSSPSTTAGLSYALKNALIAYAGRQSYGRHLYATSLLGSSAGDLLDSGQANHETGVYVGGFTAVNGGVEPGVTDNDNVDAFTQFDWTYTSLARCLLVDNGVNFLLRSNELDLTPWTDPGASVTADQATDVFGAVEADELIEDTSTGNHNVEQSYTRASVAEYWTASVVIEENTQQRIRLEVDDGAGNGGFAHFDANTGTIGTNGPLGTGINAFETIHDYGGGRYRCRVSCRLPATTTARFRAYLCNGASDSFSYTGDGSSSIFLSDAQLQRGGQLGRITRTAGTVAAGAAQSGSELFVKGLDEDADGQMLAGDQMELNGQLLMLTEDLDGDESGTGIARVWPRIRTAPTDEDAVVLEKPEGRYMLTNPNNGWPTVAGARSDFVIDLTEDLRR